MTKVVIVWRWNEGGRARKGSQGPREMAMEAKGSVSGNDATAAGGEAFQLLCHWTYYKKCRGNILLYIAIFSDMCHAVCSWGCLAGVTRHAYVNELTYWLFVESIQKNTDIVFIQWEYTTWYSITRIHQPTCHIQATNVEKIQHFTSGHPCDLSNQMDVNPQMQWNGLDDEDDAQAVWTWSMMQIWQKTVRMAKMMGEQVRTKVWSMSLGGSLRKWIQWFSDTYL